MYALNSSYHSEQVKKVNSIQTQFFEEKKPKNCMIFELEFDSDLSLAKGPISSGKAVTGLPPKYVFSHFY